MIYIGTSPTDKKTGGGIGKSAYNTNYDDNAYVGYMYGTPGSDTYEETHANEHDSTIKQYLDDWYEENLSSYSGYLADTGFCNDRSVAPEPEIWDEYDTALGYAGNYTLYGVTVRLTDTYNFLTKENAQPQFKCPNEDNDLFTTNTSPKGNKALIYPIGLITADEVAYAGGPVGITNRKMYLTKNSFHYTMSPMYFNDYNVSGNVFTSGSSSNSSEVYSEKNVFPVINLRSNVELSSQLPSGCTKLDGTVNCPYIIK